MNNVIILGKPNVGKSSLFNAIVMKELAVVSRSEKLTRDLKKKKITINENNLILIDTPGIINSKLKIEKKIKDLTLAEASICSLILVVFDCKNELTSDDYEVISILRKISKKKIIVLNKTEGQINQATFDELTSSGLGPTIMISSAHKIGIERLKDEIINSVETESYNSNKNNEFESEFSVALVGKTNCGKSTLINSLKGEYVSITGNMPHLTRDSVETQVKKKKKIFRVIDTAGFSKDLNNKKNINKVFIELTKKKIRLSQIILVMMDINDFYERLHSRIIKLVCEEYRCMLLVVNKIDIKKGFSKSLIQKKIYELNPQIKGLPIFFISAKKNIGTTTLINGIAKQLKIWKKKISTSALNKWLGTTVKNNPPPLIKSKQVKLKFISQCNISPPKFNIFVNINDIKTDYKRFIENNLKKKFGLNGLPIKIIYKRTKNPYEK